MPDPKAIKYTITLDEREMDILGDMFQDATSYCEGENGGYVLEPYERAMVRKFTIVYHHIANQARSQRAQS